MITVVLPSTLRVTDSDRLEIHEPVATVGELVESIDRRVPGFRDQLDDSVFNFAVNDEILLHHARERALRDGDVVEVIPTISGGCSNTTNSKLQKRRNKIGLSSFFWSLEFGVWSLEFGWSGPCRSTSGPTTLKWSPAGLGCVGVRGLHERDDDDRADQQQRDESFSITREIAIDIHGVPS